ncbi:AAA family ATPase [Neorhizobium alkalisoli]|uniref:Putative kinase n=1 Tax=Neorhizobium alkalisoli TaxID=528178 RepID=A0A561QH92_9HYPH|nr:putative kinase [Neorhizobium alkalisoli]
MLIILGGLPASGKTTIAIALAKRLGAVHVRVDTIEQALRSSGMLAKDEGPAGYMAAYGIAGDNLAVGRTVIADSVNAFEITREAWRSVARRAGVPAVEVEIFCSDKAEHRRRAESRPTDVPGLVKPDWDRIAGRTYEDWGPGPLRLDTALMPAEDCVLWLTEQVTRR